MNRVANVVANQGCQVYNDCNMGYLLSASGYKKNLHSLSVHGLTDNRAKPTIFGSLTASNESSNQEARRPS
jgi:hypothetical protein